jgi:hypothetical protein
LGFPGHTLFNYHQVSAFTHPTTSGPTTLFQLTLKVSLQITLPKFLHSTHTFIVSGFDGHQPFLFGSYKNNRKLNEEITPRSAVMVIFSVRAYELSSRVVMNFGIQYGVSFNVQSVILLADPIPQDMGIDVPSVIDLHLGVISDTNSNGEDEDEQKITDTEENTHAFIL